jgi:cobalt/nickel transport system permease protein
LAAAFVFVLQMLNFPVAAGTSGHLLGGALVAILLGPWIAVAVMTVVIVVQALVFADGGVSAIGLNVLNMAIVTVLVGWLVFRGVMWFLPRTGASVIIATMVASWASVVTASMAFVIEYAIGGSGSVEVSTVLGAVVGVHALIGIGEGVIGGLLISAVLATRPDLVKGATTVGMMGIQRARVGRAAVTAFVASGIVSAIMLVVVVAPHADSSPDGLERVAIDHGIAGSAVDSATSGSPLAEYGVAGVEATALSTILAGIVGLLVTFVIGGLVMRWSSRRVSTEAVST